MTVGQLAKKLSITPESVRFYTRKGLVLPLKNKENGYRVYSKIDENRLQFIVNARHLGFSIKDISKILLQADESDTACPLVRELIKQRLAQTEVQYQQSKALREKMKAAITQWQSLPDRESSKEILCHLIDSFVQPY
jgi:DNA-binding transcriptional MerR regulator